MQSTLDFKDFITRNNIFNMHKMRKNGNRTGKSTNFYKENIEKFEALLNKYSTDILVEAILLEFDIIERKTCKVCGKHTKFSSRLNDYTICCSKKCQSILSNEKRSDTCIAKYGSKHPMKSVVCKEKQKATNKKKYGVENVYQMPEVKKKIIDTNIEKYGVTHFSKSADYTSKVKETCLEKYDVQHQMKSNDIKEKRKSTLLEKYGSLSHQPIANETDLNVEFLIKNFTDEQNMIVIEDVLEYFSCCRNFWVN